IDSFVARYDTAGNQIWGRQFGSAVTDLTCDLAVDAAGDVVIGGHRNGSAVLAKYTSSGDQLWIRSIDTPTNDWFFDMALDSAGNVLFVGDVYYSSSDQSAALLMKTDAEGALLWSRQYDPSGITDEVWNGVAADSDGNIYVAGGYGPSWGYEGPGVMLLSKYDEA